MLQNKNRNAREGKKTTKKTPTCHFHWLGLRLITDEPAGTRAGNEKERRTAFQRGLGQGPQPGAHKLGGWGGQAGGRKLSALGTEK